MALADLLADADGDCERDAPLADGDALGEVLCPPDDWVCELDVVPALLLAVLENSVVMPNAVTALSSVVRQVMRDSLRSPESLPAVRLLCLMAVTQPVAWLRAHQGRASDSLSAGAAGRSPPDRPAAESGCHPMLARSSQIAAGLDGSMAACSVRPGRS